jgi:predicted transposase YbfD/YdcC
MEEQGMNTTYVRPFHEVLLGLPDHRHRQGCRHALATVLTVVILALVSGQDSLHQIAYWAQGLNLAMRRRLHFRHDQAPSYSTFERVLRHLDTDALAVRLQEWVEEVLIAYPATTWQAVAIDGKTLRGSGDDTAQLPALQMLSAMVHQLGAIICSEPVPVGTNELGAIQKVLETLTLTGRVITLDAQFTQREIAQCILDRDGHYLMRVKANQPRLLQTLTDWFDQDSPLPLGATRTLHRTKRGHGRVVHYTLQTTTALNRYLKQEWAWPGVGQAVRIERRSEIVKSGQVGTTVHYGITDLSPEAASPQTLLRLWSHHWDIENRGYWVLDAVLREDRSTIRKGTGARAMALLRRGIMTLLRLSDWDQITEARSHLGANPASACALIGIPLE